jgi:ribonuclease HII
VDAAEIDHINILQATLRAMEKAVVGLGGPQPDFILVDGNQRPKVSSSKIGPKDLSCVSTEGSSVEKNIGDMMRVKTL